MFRQVLLCTDTIIYSSSIKSSILEYLVNCCLLSSSSFLYYFPPPHTLLTKQSCPLLINCITVMRFLTFSLVPTAIHKQTQVQASILRFDSFLITSRYENGVILKSLFLREFLLSWNLDNYFKSVKCNTICNTFPIKPTCRFSSVDRSFITSNGAGSRFSSLFLLLNKVHLLHSSLLTEFALQK